VLAQLACEVKVVRQIPRSVFYPVPRVDSVLLRLVRRAQAPSPELRAFVRAAFAHRRKTMAGSLALASAHDPDLVRASLAKLAKPPNLRAEALRPDEFQALWEAL
jgi:16S rRNA (adenine1518-N6/adenine1519-N6)-dimethyltransferase